MRPVRKVARRSMPHNRPQTNAVQRMPHLRKPLTSYRRKITQTAAICRASKPANGDAKSIHKHRLGGNHSENSGFFNK